MEKGWTALETARKFGVTQGRYSNWETQQRLPQPDIIADAARIFGESASWLAGYTNTRGEQADEYYVSATNTKTKLQSGEVAALDSIASDSVAFHKDYLKDRRLEENQIVLIRVTDDAMDSIISEGDEVLIDQRAKAVTKADLFAIWVNGQVWIRRIRPELDGTLSIASENHDRYPSVSVNDLSSVNLIGRVCRIIKDV
ncbi:hypothetical protein GZ77_26420 [Endozoicomonas montiporae]|uniref:HTH cro/C1-type domain-containing protein n=2 Tax=Endozoicomonas montiporae TaxID=1027273 RepID=A0A081MYG4_9GAMM|nr:hypothetical protein GZ77_26420 [Endozoicomonas montiporae]